ncbi:hypothetical protein BCR43DRAFT_119739 [Syncephalastrum racemosum]|uniref:Uncharacterized protein n=1 Tax=Syncephalastrum racemosum TaxID=13706 RepID=A0A1X2GZK0_SYNRA|nr:hypothetical protein BCR43DRAFT_119739 [Syncephalastrum racemosum]
MRQFFCGGWTTPFFTGFFKFGPCAAPKNKILLSLPLFPLHMNVNELASLLYFVQKEAGVAGHGRKTLEDRVASHRRAILTRVDDYCQQWSHSVRKLSKHLDPSTLSALSDRRKPRRF